MSSVGDGIEGFIDISDIVLYYAWMWRGSTRLYMERLIYPHRTRTRSLGHCACAWQVSMKTTRKVVKRGQVRARIAQLVAELARSLFRRTSPHSPQSRGARSTAPVPLARYILCIFKFICRACASLKLVCRLQLWLPLTAQPWPSARIVPYLNKLFTTVSPASSYRRSPAKARPTTRPVSPAKEELHPFMAASSVTPQTHEGRKLPTNVVFLFILLKRTMDPVTCLAICFSLASQRTKAGSCQRRKLLSRSILSTRCFQ